MKTLGILITSEQFAKYAAPMVRAAHAKGVAVHIHLTGSGVLLTRSTDFDTLAQLAQITICRESAVFHQLKDQLRVDLGKLLARPDQMSRLMERCDRHVVL